MYQRDVAKKLATRHFHAEIQNIITVKDAGFPLQPPREEHK